LGHQQDLCTVYTHYMHIKLHIYPLQTALKFLLMEVTSNHPCTWLDVWCPVHGNIIRVKTKDNSAQRSSMLTSHPSSGCCLPKASFPSFYWGEWCNFWTCWFNIFNFSEPLCEWFVFLLSWKSISNLIRLLFLELHVFFGIKDELLVWIQWDSQWPI
jgi:hypothetical protein